VSAARLRITGVVQGVGFRPFVYNLARSHLLTGWVNNTSEGVFAVVEGADDAIAAFVREVRDLAPVQAVVETVEVTQVEPEGLADFAIRESEAAEGAMTLVSPDIATCPACLTELRDPGDRRHRYPFVNCTNCGPRFTIIEDVPYDRPKTTMRDFPMCRACEAEYRDPGDRRFHAQPNACPVCGPRLYLNVKGRARSGWSWEPASEKVPRPHHQATAEHQRTDDILQAARFMLEGGDILAIKGLGGFHLACDATNEAAVARLRDRKRRWGRPFAIMFPSLEAAREHCAIDEQEAALLEGSVRPIVLAKVKGRDQEVKRQDIAVASPLAAPLRALSSECPSASPTNTPAEARCAVPPATSAASCAPLAASVAPGLAELGVMLPYTPLHHVLLADLGRPLVMTSGNLSDEPIAMDNAEALARLAPIADGFLLHDRGIYARYDDSVLRVVAGRVEMVRRSRGYAPFPLRLPSASGLQVFAAGPEQKNTFCLTKDRYAFVSQHVGDMENAETLEHYESSLALYERMFRVEPELVAYDLHPEYLSTKFALSLGLPTEGVQHHHAHVVAVAAEHGIREPVVGVAFDGTGYGSDGTIWGGEVLVATWRDFERFAHLRAVPMPGGAAAVSRPARMALGLLSGLDRGLLDHPGLIHLHSELATDELTTILAMADRGINSPLTSSMGRLFDAVAAISGIRSDALYEGQPAIELEVAADPGETGAYRFELTGSSPLVIDPLPVVAALLDDLAAGLDRGIVSARFHNAVIAMTVEVARRAAAASGARYVVLSGGVMMNRLLLAGALRGVEAAGLTPLLPRDLPVNDGAISFGQAVVALARRDAV
jgi:hydrogenase maturation protein HypF